MLLSSLLSLLLLLVLLLLVVVVLLLLLLLCCKWTSSRVERNARQRACCMQDKDQGLERQLCKLVPNTALDAPRTRSTRFQEHEYTVCVMNMGATHDMSITQGSVSGRLNPPRAWNAYMKSRASSCLRPVGSIILPPCLGIPHLLLSRSSGDGGCHDTPSCGPQRVYEISIRENGPDSWVFRTFKRHLEVEASLASWDPSLSLRNSGGLTCLTLLV